MLYGCATQTIWYLFGVKSPIQAPAVQYAGVARHALENQQKLPIAK
jgi:hypothetical protein